MQQPHLSRTPKTLTRTQPLSCWCHHRCSRHTDHIHHRHIQNTKTNAITKNITQHALITTLTKETIAMSLYFGVYHYIRKHDYCSCFHAGGIAGVASWWLTFPLDTLRNRQIVHNTTIRNAYRMGSVWSGVYLFDKSLYREWCVIFDL